MTNFASKLKTGLNNAAKVAKGALGVAASGVVALGKIGLDYNKQIETYATNFQVMLGDAESAAKKVEELKQMGAKTPFELGDLANATQTLLAFNVTADDSTGVLSKLGDISLGNVSKLESLTRAYGKMNASQKVSLEDINMMIDAGFNPLLIVAEETGKTMTEVYADVSKGAVSFEQIQGAIDKATSAGGQFYQGMAQASQTTEGLISTLKDNVTSKIGELFTGVSEKGKAFLPKIIAFVDGIDTTKIITGIENAIASFEKFAPVIAAATGAMVGYKAASAISGVIDALKTATEGQTIAQTLLNAVMNANPFVLVASAVAAVGTALVTLYATNEDFRNKIKTTWENVKTTFSSAATFIKTSFGEVVDWFTSIPEKFKTIGTNIVAGLKTGISDAWKNLKEWFTSLFGDLTAIAKEILGIHSPSTVFKQFGKYIDEGLAIGIDQNSNKPFKEMERLSQGITGEFTHTYVSDVNASAVTVPGGNDSTVRLLEEIRDMLYSGKLQSVSTIENTRDLRRALYI